MAKYVALLRAINVGGHTVKMDHLRNLFESMGFANVETFIATGNVVFDAKSGKAKSLEEKIEKHLREALGYEVSTFLRTTTELKSVADYQPFSIAELHAATRFMSALSPTAPALRRDRNFCHTAARLTTFASLAANICWLCRTKMGVTQSFPGLWRKRLWACARPSETRLPSEKWPRSIRDATAAVDRPLAGSG